MGLSNEVIFALVAQWAAMLPEVKVGGTKKSWTESRAAPEWCRSVRAAKFFFRPPNLTFGSFAVS